MEKWARLSGLLVILWCFSACSVVRQVENLPDDTYAVPSRLFQEAEATSAEQKRIKATLALTDSTLFVDPVTEGTATLKIDLEEIKSFRFYRRTFDVDVLTIPFKVRPSVKGFPEQLNPNFSAALYLGRRIDVYHITPNRTNGSKRISLSGVGFGYGGFVGIGAVTMNPFVTQDAISYEYDGFVVTLGTAAIYDAKKFNLGLAIGSDFLVDDNRDVWIYHRKPWFGLLFGINLN